MNRPTRKATINFLIGTGIAAAIASVNLFRWVHYSSPDAHINTILWLICLAVSLITGISHVIYYRNHRDYFAEEMEHRRSLAKNR